MSRIFITGSADGLGLATARDLFDKGHEIVVHVRNRQRLGAVQDLLSKGARVVIGDLSDLQQTEDVAGQVSQLGRMDVVIHNAGVGSGVHVLSVNVIAPYVLTALIYRPNRLIYLSSSMHLGGRPVLEGLDWSGVDVQGSYSDSKLFVTALAAVVARRWPDVISSAVDPGWVPTKMGGPEAPDDLRLGRLTQEWLAISESPEALMSGAYWQHQRRIEAHPASRDAFFQNKLLMKLEDVTGVAMPGP